MEDCVWLRSMLTSELEVRPPRSERKEKKALAGFCTTIYDNGRLVAFAEMRKVGSHFEISTVLVDPAHRGRGVGKSLIRTSVEQIEGSLVLCCTKNPAMAKVLKSLGFTAVGWPGISTAIGLTINTIGRLLSMLIRFEFKRIWIQGKGILAYERYVLEKAEKQ
ncbi:MAG TPA: GNAT family N-acetyltransferase [Candidatus Poseidoniaceae archaeon]|nr:GNAT family N-acetyltransferase [Candidatus Poseidoniaceae archaeon]